ncbi:MAG: TM0106 family RecB-like putative nuclease [Patescibacteria group bacterium]
MKNYITEQSFYKYLKCPSWIPREIKRGEDLREALMQKLQDDGLLRDKELELLKDRNINEIGIDDIDEATQRTIELMKRGAETIYKGVLTHGRWVARPDVMEKVEGKSRFGEYYYIACDIKRSHHMKDEYKFQGAFYAELLQKIQDLKPIKGYVMFADGTVEGYLHEEFETQFQLTLDSIEQILDGEEESHFLTSGCKQAPFFSECQLETKECDDLSLLNRVWRSEVQSLRDSGIETVTKLADASMGDLKRVSGLTMDRLYFLQQQAISLIDDRVIRMGEIELPEENGPALIIDIESDPLRDSDYLFGVLVVDGNDQTYHPFLARDPLEEKAAWDEFTNFLKDYSQSNIYHYGWYEVDVFRKLVGKYGAPEEVRRQFEENMIDLLTRMREKIIFPMPFYSLKDIAKFLGFKWSRDDASGAESVLWYEEWLTGQDENVLQDILDYNEDDVRATWFIREWIIKTYK